MSLAPVTHWTKLALRAVGALERIADALEHMAGINEGGVPEETDDAAA